MVLFMHFSFIMADKLMKELLVERWKKLAYEFTDPAPEVIRASYDPAVGLWRATGGSLAQPIQGVTLDALKRELETYLADRKVAVPETAYSCELRILLQAADG